MAAQSSTPQSTHSTPSRPTEVTGGCLCEAIRYTVKFPRDSDWPPLAYGTCQCTMCRKWTGALVSRGFTVPTSNIHPPLPTQPTYGRYDSSPNGYRSFCTRCGSAVAFNCVDVPQETELWLGNLDEESLVGTKVAGSERETVHGVAHERQGGVGVLLCPRPTTSIYLENAIPGATDRFDGVKFWTDERHGKPGFE